MPRTVLVTGAAGFIGSHLVDRLLARGDRVVGLDNFDDFYPAETKRRNVAGALRSARFRLVEGDVRDAKALDALFASERFDAVVHLAARAGVRPSLAQPALYADVNVRGTTVLFEAARRAKVRRIVFASSSSVYGGNEKVPFSEEDPVERPISPYAATKRATELIAWTFHHLYGMDAIGLRFFTVYGPRQRPEMAIHKFTRLIDEGRPVPMYGDGSSRRDYTYIDDCIDGVVAALDRAAGFRMYNLGEARTVALSELVGLIGRALGREPEIEPLPPQPGDVPVTFADISRARSELGYDPRVPIEEGIARFVRWYRDRRGGDGS
ncbi:MAG: SDR family NAD(P)-dependent oxidoreductase [Acidobacteria bacterium]|nr:MAG: SDR family NAD(P)-dependent oxidoreductase [Acidobacteriota bacterium]